jgi:hypothetical protein
MKLHEPVVLLCDTKAVGSQELRFAERIAETLNVRN